MVRKKYNRPHKRTKVAQDMRTREWVATCGECGTQKRTTKSKGAAVQLVHYHGVSSHNFDPADEVY